MIPGVRHRALEVYYYYYYYYYLWPNTCYRLDFSIDSNIIEVEELRKSKITSVSMTADLENNKQFGKGGLTLKIKVNRQGQVNTFGFIEIPGIANVRIDTKIESIACILPEISKVVGKCVWPWVPRSNVEVTGFIFTFLISSSSKMLELTPRSNLYHVWNRR